MGSAHPFLVRDTLAHHLAAAFLVLCRLVQEDKDLCLVSSRGGTKSEAEEVGEGKQS